MKSITSRPICIAIILSGLFVLPAFADDYYQYNDAYEEPSDSGGGALYIGFGSLNLNPVKAYEQGVGDTAWYLKGAFSVETRDNLLFSLGLSGYFYEDYEYFYHEMEDHWGDRWVETSDASSFNLFGEIGYRLDIDSHLSIDLVAGYEKILASDRSISDCYDCYSEDIDFASGAYVSPRINYVSDSGLLLGLSYQSYASEDLESAVTFSIGFSH